MKRSELLNNPVFQKALPTCRLFVVRITHIDKPIKGIGEFKKDFSTRQELAFDIGVPLITKEQMEKTLRKLKCRGVKNWDPDLVFLFPDSILAPGDCDVVQTEDGNLVLRPYWTDKNGTKIYFDNYCL